MPAISKRLTSLPPYPFAVLSQRVRELSASGADVIRLDIGSPDLPPPDPVVEALARSARKPDRHGYAGYKGTPEFREAVAGYYARRFDVHLDPETEVLPLLGSKEGIVNLALAYVDQESGALVPDVGYPSYSAGARLAGGAVVWLPAGADRGYRPDLRAVPADDAARAKLLWVNYPNNPTGAIADPGFYQKAVDFCRANDVILASDNPYCDVTYDGYVAPSALQADGARECTVEFMSLSKTFNMAGWRLGAAVGSAQILRHLLTIKSNMDSGHFHAVYDAGIEALRTPRAWIDERNRTYEARRNRILAALPSIGLAAETPKGSLYVWARTADGDGSAYAEAALTGAGVVLAPGGIYGPGGSSFVRISVGMNDARLDEALDRLKIWYASTQ